MSLQFTNLFVIALLILAACFSVKAKKLTLLAAITGFFCGVTIYIGAGYLGLTMLITFFLAGTLATGWGRQRKVFLEKTGDSVQRKPGQVLANGGVAALMALMVIIFPSQSAVLLVMLAASLASATADTLSSELGMLYGKSFYNCITWKKEARGLDGVVSLEGTLIGVAGATLIAGIFAIAADYDNRFLIIVIAGAAGNLSDSIFGATLERRKLLNNDLVNFLSTLFAAVVAFFLYLILKRF